MIQTALQPDLFDLSYLAEYLAKNKKLFFDKIMDNIRKLYKAGLVHADLSAFNILNSPTI